MPTHTFTLLDDLTVLDARGPDVTRFLQGQVSHDVTLLAERGSLLAALNNPQGRVIAVLRLLHAASDHVLIVLPAELAATVQQLLMKFVLRAKVTLVAGGETWRVYGRTAVPGETAGAAQLSMPMATPGWRQLVVAPRNEPLPATDFASADSWRLADMEAGLPQVYAATSGSFVAQMLNLDLVDAISLTKGCYTGQEVVARAHYRGQVKRRMQRFHTASTTVLAPGARVQLGDGRSAQIVMAAQASGGGQQFLAVTALRNAGDATEELPVATAPEVPQERLAATQLSLPYTLPRQVGGPGGD